MCDGTVQWEECSIYDTLICIGFFWRSEMQDGLHHKLKVLTQEYEQGIKYE
jgi:hypothetical protein